MTLSLLSMLHDFPDAFLVFAASGELWTEEDTDTSDELSLLLLLTEPACLIALIHLRHIASDSAYIPASLVLAFQRYLCASNLEKVCL